QAELGDLVGCSAEYIRKIEQGTRRPSKDIALLLADALHLLPEQRDAFILAVRSLPSSESGETRTVQAPVRAIHSLINVIGREREITRIAAMLADPECRLLTIFGPGGIGKTELALAAAQEQEASFRNGITTAMLASVQSAAMLPSALTDALSIPLYGDND